MLGTIGGDPRAISEANRLAIQRLSDAVDCCRPAVCPDKDDATGCTLAMQPTSAWTGLFYQFYRGPFWSAASLTEYLQLLYLNNMSLAGVAPGLGAAQLSELMLLHQSELDVTEDQIATQSFGSDLLAHLLATMQQLLLGRTLPGLASHRGDKLVYYAGHDLNPSRRAGPRLRDHPAVRHWPGGLVPARGLPAAGPQLHQSRVRVHRACGRLVTAIR